MKISELNEKVERVSDCVDHVRLEYVDAVAKLQIRALYGLVIAAFAILGSVAYVVRTFDELATRVVVLERHVNGMDEDIDDIKQTEEGDEGWNPFN